MSLKLDYRQPFTLAYLEVALDKSSVIDPRTDRLIEQYFDDHDNRCTLAYASATNYLKVVNIIQAGTFLVVHDISIEMSFLASIYDKAYADHIGKLQHEYKKLHDHYIKDQEEMVKYKTVVGSINVKYLNDYRTSFMTMIDHIIEAKREVLEVH